MREKSTLQYTVKKEGVFFNNLYYLNFKNILVGILQFTCFLSQQYAMFYGLNNFMFHAVHKFFFQEYIYFFALFSFCY